MSISRDDAERMGRAVASAAHEHWGLFLVEGILLVILGLIAIAVPPIATLAFTILIGWVFLASGIVGLITNFWARQAPGFWWALVSAKEVGDAHDGLNDWNESVDLRQLSICERQRYRAEQRQEDEAKKCNSALSHACGYARDHDREILSRAGS